MEALTKITAEIPLWSKLLRHFYINRLTKLIYSAILYLR